MAMIKRVIYFVILVFVTVSIVNFWLSRKSFTFSEDEFVKIAKKYISESFVFNLCLTMQGLD